MYILDYFIEWWNLRPRRLRKPNVNDLDLYFVEDAHEKLLRILNFRRRVPIFITGRQNDLYGQAKGLHIYRVLYSVIFIPNTGNDMIFNLAHEMFHEYQHENYGDRYKQMTLEEREIEAEGFAVAYCEHRGLNLAAPDKKMFLPQKIDHIYFSDKTKLNVTDGMPSAVREFANKCFEMFQLDK